MKINISTAQNQSSNILAFTTRYLKKIKKKHYITITVIISIILCFGVYQWNRLKQSKMIKTSEVLSCFSETNTKICNRWGFKSLSLKKLNIQNKTFTRCTCEGSTFKKITIQNSDFRQNNFRLSFFEDILFSKTNLQQSSFEGATIKNTIFEGVKINGVIFKFTTFINVQFKNTDMTQALFIGSRFKNSTYDKSTKLPFSKEIAESLGLREVDSDSI